MSTGMIVVFIVASFGSMAWSQSTSDWQSLTDHRANGPFCQGTSPQDWDKFGVMGKKSKGIARVLPQVRTSGDPFTFDYVKSLAKEFQKINQVFEDSSTRFWVAYDGKTTGFIGDGERSYRVHWYVVVPSKPVVCAMDIIFDDPALTEQAKLIAQSLRGAK